MFMKKTLAAVIPAYNEENQIGKVIETMPDYVDYIVIANDKSTDNTSSVIKKYQKKNKKVILIEHEKNQGVGGAIASGYQWCADNDIDMAVVMAGDAQMDPEDLPMLAEPVAKGEVDYTKGNRLTHPESYNIPRYRFWGNAILSLLTKIASGYWHIADSQTGYTVISKRALKEIDWSKMYKRYGQPNDLLVKLNIHNFKVRDVPIRPVYNVGEASGIKVRKVVFTISWLLLKLFFYRLKEKYVIRDFHPLVLFYGLGFTLGGISTLLFLRVAYMWIADGFAPPMTSMAFMFSTIMCWQTLFFSMWFDMEANKDLR